MIQTCLIITRPFVALLVGLVTTVLCKIYTIQHTKCLSASRATSMVPSPVVVAVLTLSYGLLLPSIVHLLLLISFNGRTSILVSILDNVYASPDQCADWTQMAVECAKAAVALYSYQQAYRYKQGAKTLTNTTFNTICCKGHLFALLVMVVKWSLVVVHGVKKPQNPVQILYDHHVPGILERWMPVALNSGKSRLTIICFANPSLRRECSCLARTSANHTLCVESSHPIFSNPPEFTGKLVASVSVCCTQSATTFASVDWNKLR